MTLVNEWIGTVPFELYQLRLLELVAVERNFTKAAARAGITQSAITRQIGGMEERLGIALFRRTTRSVQLTEAGRFFLGEARGLLEHAEGSLRRLREEFVKAPREVRIGVSHSISLAHLPGILHANVKQTPGNRYHVTTLAEQDVIQGVESQRFDLGILCPPGKLPATVRRVHKFKDAFVLIGSAVHATSLSEIGQDREALGRWLSEQIWLSIDGSSETGLQLARWIEKHDWRIPSSMQVDGFDLLVHLVGLGLGIGFVPVRSLATFARRRTVERLPMPDKFVREIAVVTSPAGRLSPHLRQFVDNLLF